MFAEHISVADVGNTDSLLLILENQPTDNPISKIQTPKINIGNIGSHKPVPTLRGHINIGSALDTNVLLFAMLAEY